MKNDEPGATDPTQTTGSRRRVTRRKGVRSRIDLPISLENLSDTAQQLLEAARRVYEQKGAGALSYESVGVEAGLSPSLVRYHFGSKRELLVVLADWLLSEAGTSSVWDIATAESPDESLEVLMRTFRGWESARSGYSLLFDLLPQMLHDEDGRRRLGELFESLGSPIADALQPQARDEEDGADIRALIDMTFALADGLGLRRLMDPDSVDMDRVLALWREYLAWILHHRSAPSS